MDSIPSEPAGKPYVHTGHAQIRLRIHIHACPSFQAHGPHRLRLAAHAEASSRLPIAEDSVHTQQRRAIAHHVLAFSLHTPPMEQQPLIIADCRTATPPCQRERRSSPPGLSCFGTKTHLPADPCEWPLLMWQRSRETLEAAQRAHPARIPFRGAVATLLSCAPRDSYQRPEARVIYFSSSVYCQLHPSVLQGCEPHFVKSLKGEEAHATWGNLATFNFLDAMEYL